MARKRHPTINATLTSLSPSSRGFRRILPMATCPQIIPATAPSGPATMPAIDNHIATVASGSFTLGTGLACGMLIVLPNVQGELPLTGEQASLAQKPSAGAARAGAAGVTEVRRRSGCP